MIKRKGEICIPFIKNIGFVAHGPASANSLLPIIKQIKNSTNVKLFAFHPYVANLWGCERLEPGVDSVDYSNLDLVVYGTGSGHEIELNVPIEARKYGVPSISILDCFWATEDNLYLRYKNQPTYIITPNKETKRTIEKLNFLPNGRIIPLGNPHFDRLEKLKQDNEILTFPINIVFYSQCGNVTDFSDTDEFCKEGLRDLVDYRKRFPDKIAQITVAPHPREDTTWLVHFCKENDFLIKDNDSMNLLLSTDMSIGVSCTLQYEAQIIGKPTIFYQNRNALFKSLNSLGIDKAETPIKDFNSTEKCVEFILSL